MPQSGTGATSISPWEEAGSVLMRLPGISGIKLARKVNDVYRIHSHQNGGVIVALNRL